MVSEHGLRLSALRSKVGSLSSGVAAKAELERLVDATEGELDRLRTHWVETRQLLTELDPRGIEAQAKALRRARDAALTEAQRASIEAELGPVTARYEMVHAVWDGLDELELEAGRVVAELETLIAEAIAMSRRPTARRDGVMADSTSDSMAVAAQAVRDRLQAIEEARVELGLPPGVPSGPPAERMF